MCHDEDHDPRRRRPALLHGPGFAQDGEAHGSRGNQEIIGVDLDTGGV